MHKISSGGARPKKKSGLAYYSGKYYACRLKANFDALWEDSKKTLGPKFRRWNAKPDDFKKALVEEVAEAYVEVKRKWKEGYVGREGNTEGYHEVLESFDEVGIPLADALAERLGMHVIIMAVGPVGSQRGEVWRWYVEGVGGNLTAAEASVTCYGRAFFTKEQCRDRAWPPLEGGVPAPEGGPVGVPNLDNLIQLTPEGSAPETAAPVVPSTPGTAPDAVPDAAPDAMPDTDDHETPPVVVYGNMPGPGDEHWGWSKALRTALPYMAGKNRGPQWVELTEAMVEIGQWMKEHRKTGDYPVGEGFGRRLLVWWRDIGPEWRKQPRPDDLLEDQEWSEKTSWQEDTAVRWVDWYPLRKSGPNGMILVALALTWWGQMIYNTGTATGLGGSEATLAADVDWQYLVGDVTYSFGELTDDLEPAVLSEWQDRLLEEHNEKQKSGGMKGGKAGKKTVAAKDNVPAKKAPTMRKRKCAEDEQEEEGEPETARMTRSKRAALESGGKPVPRPTPRPNGNMKNTASTGPTVTSSAMDTTENQLPNSNPTSKPDSCPSPGPTTLLNSSTAGTENRGPNDGEPAPDTHLSPIPATPPNGSTAENCGPDGGEPAPDTAPDTHLSPVPATPPNADPSSPRTTVLPQDIGMDSQDDHTRPGSVPAIEIIQDIEMGAPENVAENPADMDPGEHTDVDVDALDFDPFKDDPLAGLTEEERRELELDPDADEDDLNGGSGEE
ncbi:hypothetical protein DFH07DRAFT_772308 [Mycena maculata]|uniref:Uncharacterized protein n=1 Tax=Mycena maculata TaxID=230809 RepID=A0AAD7NEP8_9AGAR|nr:hypothetical protein DFH07DRAFT_772308 [Mycena maculata]